MRYLLMAFSILLGSAMPAAPAMAGAGVAVSAVSIGIHLSAYPELVPIPGYPVYYAPRLHANYFFHDGFYWIYHDDRWYVSAWYNGPWDFVDPHDVPLIVLQVPVRYYPAPPVYFHAWVFDAPPRWDLHWGHRWAQQRHDWDRHRVVRRHAAPPVNRQQHAAPASPRVQYRREPDRHSPRHADVRRHEGRSGFRSAPRDRTRLPQTVTPLPQVQTPFRGDEQRRYRAQPRSVQRAAPAPRMQAREGQQANGNGRQFRGNAEGHRAGPRSGFEARGRGRN